MKTKNQNNKASEQKNQAKENLSKEKNTNQEQTKQQDPKEEKEKQDKQPTIEEKYEKLNDKHLRLIAEYDNYRKRTLKEKMELIKTAGQDILINFLPIIDNIERAKKSVQESSDINAVKDGIEIIYKNLIDFVNTKGVKEIEAINETFNSDLHEAVTKIPAPTKDQKGKVIDVIEKGYKLNDKIIRYAKVVVGE